MTMKRPALVQVCKFQGFLWGGVGVGTGDRSGSVAKPELPGAATFSLRSAPEPELIFLLFGAGSRSRSRFFKAAPAASFRQATKKAFFLCHT